MQIHQLSASTLITLTHYVPLAMEFNIHEKQNDKWKLNTDWTRNKYDGDDDEEEEEVARARKRKKKLNKLLFWLNQIKLLCIK